MEEEFDPSDVERYIPVLFGNIEELFEINLKLYCSLIKKNESNELRLVSTIFTNILDQLPSYNTYSSNQKNALDAVDHLCETNSFFNEYIENIKYRDESRGESLSSFLTKPIQRITRYPLFLELLIKYCNNSNERIQLMNVKVEVDQIVEMINESKRVFDAVVKILEVQSLFTSHEVSFINNIYLFQLELIYIYIF